MSIEKISVESRHELEQMITNEINQIEKGLTMICSNVPINEKASLDILCHDSNGQLVILQLDVKEDDIMLLHGIQSVDYVDKFKSFLKATYNKHKIDDKEKPRLILIAPSFSDAVRRAVEGMKGIRIDLYEWEYLKLGDHKGLRLQPIFTWKPIEKPKEEKSTEKKREVKPLKKKEHEPEPSEKKEEPEPPKSPLEPPKEELPPPPPPAEKLKEESPMPPKEEPKRKLKLF
ncbi:MAG: endonuclease NucS [Candidatus Bathyarchaeia archaeon]